MAVTCDTTLDFASDTGYTYDADEIEFIGGFARLVLGFEGSSVLQTPALDASEWAIHRVQLDYAEAVGYEHKFLVSFDGGTTWNSYGPAGWKRRNLADIGTHGFAAAVMTEIREWPEAGDLIFAVEITRAEDGGNGYLSLISVCEGTGTLTLDDEPAADATLEPNPDGPPDGCDKYLGILPDYPLSRTPMQHAESCVFDAGYNLVFPTATNRRDEYDWVWNSRIETEKDQIVTFIRLHHDVAFLWTAPGLSEKKYVFGEPEISRKAEGVYDIRCAVIQALPTGLIDIGDPPLEP